MTSAKGKSGLISLSILASLFLLPYASHASTDMERKLWCSTYLFTMEGVIQEMVLPRMPEDQKETWKNVAEILDEHSSALLSEASSFDETRARELVHQATNEALADYMNDPVNFFDPNLKIHKTIMSCIALNQEGVNVTAQTKNTAPATEPAPASEPLDFLLDGKRRWVVDRITNRSGQSCNALLGASKTTMAMQQYTPTQKIISAHIGAQNPRRTDPEFKKLVASMGVVMTADYRVTSTAGVVAFTVATHNQNSPARFMDNFELDVQKGTLTRIGKTTCEQCDSSAFATQPERAVFYWCAVD